MMRSGYFVTGTDTEVGKTWVTVSLMRLFRQLGISVAGMKPVAAGCHWQQGQWKNDDALLIQENASMYFPYDLINPYAYEWAVSPHLAAEGTVLDQKKLQKNLNVIKQQVEVVLVEGAGGWLSPLSYTLDNATLAEFFRLPVILVVAVRLGCINQALLSWQAIQRSSCECAGWIAVRTEQDMLLADENIRYLKNRIATPLMGILPNMKRPDFDQLAYCLQGYFVKD